MMPTPRLERRPRVLLLGGALASFLAAAAMPAPAQSASPVVTGRMVLATDAAHAGTSAQAGLVGEIADGYHINDHHPSLDYLIPTELKLEAAAPLSPGAVVYPKGTARRFPFLDTPISVYEGKLVLTTAVQVAANARPGSYTLKGALSYQACNDHACLAPTSLPVQLTVKVVPPSVALKEANSDVAVRRKSN